jgi:hypothetical protein
VPFLLLASLGFCVAKPYMAVCSGKAAIAFNVQIKPLEQSCVFENAITASFRCFDFVVQTFHEATTATPRKVIDDFIEPIIERCQELVKTG